MRLSELRSLRNAIFVDLNLVSSAKRVHFVDELLERCESIDDV